MKKLKIYLILFFSVHISPLSSAQVADDLIKQHFDAIGLTANPVTSYKMDVIRFMGKSGIFGARVYFKAPDLWRIEYFNGDGSTPVIIVRGDSAWKISENGKVTTEQEIFSRLFVMTFPDYLCYAQTLKCKIDLKPKNETKNEYLLIYNKKKGSGLSYRSFFLNTENLLDWSGEYDGSGKPKNSSKFREYKTENGIKYSSVISEMDGKDEFLRHERKGVFVNIPLDDKLFTKPLDTINWNAPKYKVYTSMEEALKSPSLVFNLKLDNKQLTAIPAEISKFKNLESLDLSENQITEIPDFVFKLNKLIYLNLSHNKISQLPENIGNLSNLKSLYFSYNKLMNLPEGIGKLLKLKTLYINDNPITAFPASFINLKKLKDFYYSRSSILVLSASQAEFITYTTTIRFE